jgi:MFS family permease
LSGRDTEAERSACMHEADQGQFFGRRPIYIGSFTFFLIWLIPCAVAPNIQTMLIARFLDGIAGSAFLSVAGGTVGDMFARHVSAGWAYALPCANADRNSRLR